MDTQQNRWHSWRGEGLRMRFRPRSRIGQTFLTIAPWIDMLIVALFFVLLQGQLLLQPGIQVDLPQVPFREGAAYGQTLVLMSAETAAGRESVVFFDDERFVVGIPRQMELLEDVLSLHARRGGQRQLILHADARVPHGDVVQVINLVREAGIARVNVSTRPE